MTPSGKKVNLITANKVTSISPRRGGKIQEPKKEKFSQKKFNGQVDHAFWFSITQNFRCYDTSVNEKS